MNTLMTPTLSVVIPAFNEQARIGPYLAEIRGHLAAAYPGTYEVLVVDDGSRDDTAGLVNRAAGGWRELRLLRHPANRGKGTAVRTGVLESTGQKVLFADADGATPIAEEWKLSAALDRGAVVAAGSRRIDGPGVIRERNWRRSLAGGLFAWAARSAVGVTVKDTQCGFKMVDGPIGRELFRIGRETGYLFDVELLALAARSGYPVVEVAISWSERPGSKVRLVRDSLRMLRDLWQLRGRLRATPTSVPALAADCRKAA
jgi:dolichyl-phosphate beta-glucosyltransferase